MTPCSILVVEDDKLSAKLIVETLNRLGYTVAGHVTTGEEAVRRAGELGPALVIMDIVLAGLMDGITAAEQIMSRNDIPVIYMTAHTDEKILKKSKGAALYGYVYKPIRDRDLQAAIEVALDRHAFARKLIESQQWLMATLRSISEAVIATDTRGRVKFMSAMAEALTGWRHEQAVGQDIQQVIPLLDSETCEPVENYWARYLKEEAIGFGFQWYKLRRNRRILTIGCSIGAIRNEKGEPLGIVTVFKKSDRS